MGVLGCQWGGVLLLAPQLCHLRAESMQLSDLFAQPLQLVCVSLEDPELLVALAERFKPLPLFSKFLVLRAQPGERSLLYYRRSSGSDNDGGAEEPCFEFGHAHKIQEVEG